MLLISFGSSFCFVAYWLEQRTFALFLAPSAPLPIGWSNTPLLYSLLHPLRCLLVGAACFCFTPYSLRSVAYWLERHSLACFYVFVRLVLL